MTWCLKEIADLGAGQILTLVGYLDEKDKPQNALALIHGGEVKATYIKHHLPNYGVFDEFRNFGPGKGTLVARFRGVDIAVAICEDIWQDQGPMAELAKRTPGIVLVPNGSPYERKKDDVRLSLVQRRVVQIGAPMIYVNMTGAQDDLVFDGDSLAVGVDRELLARAEQFASSLTIVDVPVIEKSSTPDIVIDETPLSDRPRHTTVIAERLSDEEEVWSALVMGLGDYVRKNGFKSVALGLSGGIDSALVATIAVDALGEKIS